MFILELHEIGPINYVSYNLVRFLSQLEETSVQPDGHISEFGIVRVNGQRSPESFDLESTMAEEEMGDGSQFRCWQRNVTEIQIRSPQFLGCLEFLGNLGPGGKAQ